MPLTDLRPYLTLPDDLGEPARAPIAERPCRILLTGATGYLGAYLLAALLERSDATVVCLVRSPDAATGLARIQANLARYELACDLSRIEILPGSLEQVDLGLDPATWTRLAHEVDAIVHAAANVNFISPLESLWPVNVGGTLNLLRLAGHTRLKPLHLASSYSVFNEASYAGVTQVSEEPLVGHGDGFQRGYPMSKWLAERLTDLARDRGWSVTTHRLGLLWGDARTGRSKADDVLTLNLRACLTLGKAQDLDFLMHVTPIDFAAHAVAAIALEPVHAHGYYHVITDTPIAWRDFVQTVQALGHAVDLVPMTTWYASLRAALPAHRELTPLVLGAGPTAGTTTANIFSMHFDTSRLRAALANTGVSCPPLDRQLIATYVDASVRDTAR